MLELLVTLPPLAGIGMTMMVMGRLGLRRLADGSYRGSPLAWTGYLGGMLLLVAALAGLVSLLAWGLTT